ncbi:hypothetical protein Hamer_G023598, partial [Homarus americanus]
MVKTTLYFNRPETSSVNNFYLKIIHIHYGVSRKTENLAEKQQSCEEAGLITYA